MAVEAAFIQIHQTHAIQPAGCEPLSSFVFGDSHALKYGKQGQFEVLRDARFQDGNLPSNLHLSGHSEVDSGSVTCILDKPMIEGSVSDSVNKEKPARKVSKKKKGKKSHATGKSMQSLLLETGQQCGCQGNVSGSFQQLGEGNSLVLMKNNSRSTSVVLTSSCEVRTVESKCSTDAKAIGIGINMHVSNAAKRANCNINQGDTGSTWNTCETGMKHIEYHRQKTGVMDHFNVYPPMLENDFSPSTEPGISDEFSMSSTSSHGENNSSISVVESPKTFPPYTSHYEKETYSSISEVNLASSSRCRKNRGNNRKCEEKSHRMNLIEVHRTARGRKDACHTKVLKKWVPVHKDIKILEATASVEKYVTLDIDCQLPSGECDQLGSNRIAQTLMIPSSGLLNDSSISTGRSALEVNLTDSTSSAEKYVNLRSDSQVSGDKCNQLENNRVGQTLTALSNGLLNDSSISTSRSGLETQEDQEVNRIEFDVHTEKGQHLSIGYSSNILSESFLQFINWLTVEKAFETSYRLQLASEGVELVTGYPLAEFERLIQCVTPVIASSFSTKACESCLQNQLSSPSACRHPKPSISLHAIWNWYEEPGNYGMKVNVQDSRYQKASGADQISFDAHFVPFLSAVQLFGYQKLSPCCSTSKDEPVAGIQPVDSPKTYHCHGCDALSRSFPALVSDMELMFEFFEYEQPHQRMPFYDKVTELASAGISDDHKFGDPSKLGSANLRELHPASWFSVAWYPIYRIPEGKLRATFLTYHSLGYLVHRCLSTDPAINKNALCVLFPVIGLQSYNAQHEVWFHPKMKADGSAFEELASGLLKDRITILEENALFFSRGLICKEQARIANRQPDYEFFISRKF